MQDVFFYLRRTPLPTHKCNITLWLQLVSDTAGDAHPQHKRVGTRW